MKLLLPGGGGSGVIYQGVGVEGANSFFLPGGGGAGGIFRGWGKSEVEGAGSKPIFMI